MRRRPALMGVGAGLLALIIGAQMLGSGAWGFPGLLLASPGSGVEVHAEYTYTVLPNGTDYRFDASASHASEPISHYEWSFHAAWDRPDELITSSPILTWTFEPGGQEERGINLRVVTVSGRSDGAGEVIRLPRTTILILLPGLDPDGGADPVDPYQEAVGVFGDVLSALGCSTQITSDKITQQCNDHDRAWLQWIPFSYAGPNDLEAPLPYSGNQTFQALDISVYRLQQHIDEIRNCECDPNIVLIGHSTGGSVAAAWAARNQSAFTPVITLDSPLFGFWPENPATPQAEDQLLFCGPASATNEVAGPLTLSPLKTWLFIILCNLWNTGGFRSDVSYDWRAERVFGPNPAAATAALQLFTATNRYDIVAPPWWNVSPLSRGNKIVACDDALGHSCIYENNGDTAELFQAIVGVVNVTMTAADNGETPAHSATTLAWGANHSPAQFAGYDTRISVPFGTHAVAVGQWGSGTSSAVTTLTCVPMTAVDADTIQVRSSQWRPYAYVVFFEDNETGALQRARLRTFPYGNLTLVEGRILGNDPALAPIPNPCP